MTPWLWLVLVLTSLVTCPSDSAAQNANGTAAAASYTLAHVASTGSKLFPETDIVQATGLKPGKQIAAADLQHASELLAQTGAFAQVNYKFDGSTATFIVDDGDQFLPATFENFVWFTDADLVKRVHEKVWLFSGQLPLGGNLAEAVSGALDSIIQARGVQGHVVAAVSPATGVPTSIQFRIDGVKAEVAEIKFPGASVPQLELLQKAVKGFVGRPYTQSAMLPAILHLGRASYGRGGYLKTQFGAASVSIVRDDPTAPAIALTFPVQEGPQFTVSGADWEGNTAISTAELMKAISCKPGAIADTSCLSAAIANAQQFYNSKGYMAAQIKATATLDVEAHTATFHLTAEEGPVYHLGKIELLGLPDELAGLVHRIWQMHEGDVYDATYAKNFLVSNVRHNPSLSGWAARYVQTIHDDTLLVDLSLKFQKFSR